jgi:hypothetical protein
MVTTLTDSLALVLRSPPFGATISHVLKLTLVAPHGGELRTNNLMLTCLVYRALFISVIWDLLCARGWLSPYTRPRFKAPSERLSFLYSMFLDTAVAKHSIAIEHNYLF